MAHIKQYPLSETPFRAGDIERVIEVAKFSLAQAYQPYSKFRVGCGIMTADSSVFGGCNVETVNYDGTHAEGAALAAMVMAGKRNPVLCMCYGALEGCESVIGASCGKCRQHLMEFSLLNGTELWTVANEGWFIKLSDILPLPFGPADIGVDLAKYRR